MINKTNIKHLHKIVGKQKMRKDYILYDFNYNTFWKRHTGDNKNISCCQVLGGEE